MRFLYLTMRTAAASRRGAVRNVSAAARRAMSSSNIKNNIGRNRNVRQVEQQATLKNIFDHYGVVGPFPIISNNEAYRMNGQIGVARRTKVAQDHHLLFKSHILFPWICEVVCNDKILSTVKSIIGPDVLVANSAVHSRTGPHEEDDRSLVPWHQITADWSGKDKQSNMVVMNLALTKCDANMGGVKFVPGSHLQSLDHVSLSDGRGGQSFATSEAVEDEDGKFDKQAVGLDLELGEAVLFHPGLLQSAGSFDTNAAFEATSTILSVCYVSASSDPLSTGVFGNTALLACGKADPSSDYDVIEKRPTEELSPGALEIHRRELYTPLKA